MYCFRQVISSIAYWPLKGGPYLLSQGGISGSRVSDSSIYLAPGPPGCYQEGMDKGMGVQMGGDL